MNIYDIAKKAGVSTATVSRVINDSQSVSEKNKEKIKKIMEQEGYTPNVFARGLNLNTIKTVGLVCPDITDVNHAKPVSILERQLRERGFDTLLCCIDGKNQDKLKYMNLLLNKRVDAIILIGVTEYESQNSEPFAEFAKRAPVVVVSGLVEAENIYCVLCDEGAAIRGLLAELAADGRRRIMYVNDSETYIAMEKERAYRQGIADCGLAENGDLLLRIPDADNIIAPTYECLMDFLRDNPPPDALIAADDILVLGARRAFDEYGVDIPMIGFNNPRFADCCRPEITSVDNDMETVCSTAVRILMDALAGRECATKVTVPARLIERDTYKRARPPCSAS
jgi:LacI family transcriptional regulator/LacI family asc operon transcriptional repressor